MENIRLSDDAKRIAILLLLVIMIVELEFIFHISSFLYKILTGNLLYLVFCLLFVAAVFYAYRLNRLTEQASRFSLHNYKRTDDFENQKKIETDRELRKLTDSREFQEYRERLRSQVIRESLQRSAGRVDPEFEEFFREVGEATFNGEPEHEDYP